MPIRKYTSRDKLLERKIALPAAAGNVTTASLDLRTGFKSNTHFHQMCEFEISAPELAVGELPDAETATYDLISSDNEDLSSPTVVQAGIIVQTGAGGAGDGAEKAYFTPPSDGKRFWGLRVTTTGAVDASAKEAVLDLLF